MKRKEFIKKGTIGLGAMVAMPILTTACNDNAGVVSNPDCPTTPAEIKGPFPVKQPLDLIRQNITENRSGVLLRIDLTIQDGSEGCAPLQGASVDIWQCDAKGNYSEYDGQLDGDFTGKTFLRGRQVTDENGRVSFTSIYPGWYPGRAPHVHLEVFSRTGTSLLVTQVAFPEDISNTVYTTNEYRGSFDTSNNADDSFSDSLSQNLPDSITGNPNEGYVYSKTIHVV